jgi:hypothetical protein
VTPPRHPLNSGPDQPERDAVRHPVVDGAEKVPPTRSSTLTGMPAVRIGVPPLPPELAPTRRAPSPWGQTVMRPAPPSAKAKAKRSDPPPADGAHQSARPVVGQPDDAAALRRQLAEAQAQIDRLRQPAFPPPVSAPPDVPPPPAVPTTLSPTSWSDRRILKAVLALLGALVPLCSAAALWLTTKAYEAEAARRRLDEVAKQATSVANDAQDKAGKAQAANEALRARLAAREAYERALWRKLGVEYPARDGEPAEPVLETQTPVRKPGSVGAAPVLVVNKPAPP